MPITHVALLLTVASAPADLTRLYKADSNAAYDFTLKGKHDTGATISADATIEIVVKAIEKDGRARATFASKVFKMMMEETEIGGTDSLPTASELLDAAGLPESISVNENAWVFMLFQCGAMLPGRRLAEGETYKVVRTKGGELSGTIRFVGSVEHEGKTYLKLETKLEIKPESDPNPGQLDVVTLLDPADRWPVSIKGKLEVAGQASGEIEFKRRAVPAQ